MKYRILLIEDSVFIRYQLQQYLIDLNMEIVGEYNNPQEGIPAFEILKPDIVVVDYSLLNVTGIQVVEEILSRNIYANIVLLLPSQLFHRTQEFVGMGIKGVLTKPFYPEKVQKVMIEVAVNLSRSVSH